MLDWILRRKTFKTKGAWAVIDLRTEIGVPYVRMGGDPKQFGALVHKMVRYCKRKGIEKVATALDLSEVKPEMARLVVRRGAVPRYLIVELCVDRMTNG